MHLVLLQICSSPIGVGLLSAAMMLFNRLLRNLLPQMNRNPMNTNIDDMHYEALEAHQRKE